MNELMNTKELAAHYGVSTQCVLNWIKQGMPVAKRRKDVPCKRKIYFYRLAQVDAWMQEQHEPLDRPTVKSLSERLDALQAQVDKMQSIFTKEDEEAFKELDKELQEMDKKFADTFTLEMEAELNAELDRAEKELGDLIK